MALLSVLVQHKTLCFWFIMTELTKSAAMGCTSHATCSLYQHHSPPLPSFPRYCPPNPLHPLLRMKHFWVLIVSSHFFHTLLVCSSWSCVWLCHQSFLRSSFGLGSLSAPAAGAAAWSHCSCTWQHCRQGGTLHVSRHLIPTHFSLLSF